MKKTKNISAFMLAGLMLFVAACEAKSVETGNTVFEVETTTLDCETTGGG